MREIKFRALDGATLEHWKPKPKGMIFFDVFGVPDFINNTHNESGKWERRFNVMQYTGLKDKDGVEIYEGDIVNIFYVKDGLNHDAKYQALIRPSGVTFRYIDLLWLDHGHNQHPINLDLTVSDYGVLRSDYRNNDKRDNLCISEYDGFEYSSYIKVIGNIHENPDLLESQ